MSNYLRYASLLWPFLLLIALYSVIYFSVVYTSFPTISNFNLALSVDLLITLPFIYFLSIRKTRIPGTTILLVMVAGLFMGKAILPPEDQKVLEFFQKNIIPLAEALILVYILFQVSIFIIKVRQSKDSFDFYEAIQEVTNKKLPPLVSHVMSTEIGVIYFGLLHWKKIKLKPNEFSYFRSGTPTLIGVFIFLILIETFALHMMLVNWNEVVAWILSGLSLYTFVQFLGYARSLYKRPIKIDDGYLKLRYGIMKEADISLENIHSILIDKKSLKPEDEITKFAFFKDFESHNIKLFLNEPITMKGLYGIKSKVKNLAFHVDHPESFKTLLENNLGKKY